MKINDLHDYMPLKLHFGKAYNHYLIYHNEKRLFSSMALRALHSPKNRATIHVTQLIHFSAKKNNR